MIKCSNEAGNFATLVTNGRHQAICDVRRPKEAARPALGPMNSWGPAWPAA